MGKAWINMRSGKRELIVCGDQKGASNQFLIMYLDFNSSPSRDVHAYTQPQPA